MQILIFGKGVDLTDAVEGYVTKKMGGMEKFFQSIIRVEVTLGRESKSHVKGDVFFAEGKVVVPGHDMFAKKTAGDVYAAVDVLKDHLERELKKHKEKHKGTTKKKKMNARGNKEYQA